MTEQKQERLTLPKLLEEVLDTKDLLHKSQERLGWLFFFSLNTHINITKYCTALFKYSMLQIEVIRVATDTILELQETLLNDYEYKPLRDEDEGKLEAILAWKVPILRDLYGLDDREHA